MTLERHREYISCSCQSNRDSPNGKNGGYTIQQRQDIMHSTQFMVLAWPNTGTWNTSLSRSERLPVENAPIDTGKRGAVHKTVPRTHSPEGPAGKFWREKIIAEVRIARVTFLFLTFALSRKY